MESTGIIILMDRDTNVLRNLSIPLRKYCNVKTVIQSEANEKTGEVFLLSSSTKIIPDYKKAKIMLKYSFNLYKKKIKRRSNDRKMRKRYVRKLLNHLSRKIDKTIDKIDLNNLSSTVTWVEPSKIRADRLYNARHKQSRNTISKRKRSTSNRKQAQRKIYKSSFTQTVEDKMFYGGKSYSKQYTNKSTLKSGLRPIVIDGSNVAFSHGRNIKFSFKGLEICIHYFKKRGHKVIAVLPNYRKGFIYKYAIKEWEADGTLMYTPSRRINNHHIICEDDRFIIQSASSSRGIIVSLDQYRDYLGKNEAWDRTITKRLLMYTWVNEDEIMFPEDPLGPNGPSLQEFLQF